MFELYERGLSPRHDGLLDALVRGPEGMVLFQVLGEHGHAYEGMRQGCCV